MFSIMDAVSQKILVSEQLMIHPTNSNNYFIASMEVCNNTCTTWIEKEFCVIPDCVLHSVVVNDDDNFVFQQLEFGHSFSLIFETNLDFLQFCKFVGLDLLPKSIKEA